MNRDALTEAKGLAAFVDASPSPFHACETTRRHLESAGFQRLEEGASWSARAGRYYVLRGGSLVAWVLAEGAPASRGLRILGAHTDSPNLRVKPQPDASTAGLHQLGVEVYGSVLLNSWLNRDLGLSGRIWLRGDDGAAPTGRLFRIDRAVLCIPQLAIHLMRDINEKGLKLNPEQHLTPVWAVEDGREHGFRQLLADELDVDADRILSWDAMCHDIQPSSLLGGDRALLSAPRLDNLCSSYCALQALLAAADGATAERHVPVLALFDHEEIGSTSHRGARSSLLSSLVERLVLARGGDREDFHRTIADSICASADMAHATHPGYVELHEAQHHLHLNRGPAIKINASQRYATEGDTEAEFLTACEYADVPFQKWVNRTDLHCGSTIGPATAASLGIRTVDVGTPQLSMHAARELCGSHDPAYLVRALRSFLESPWARSSTPTASAAGRSS